MFCITVVHLSTFKWRLTTGVCACQAGTLPLSNGPTQDTFSESFPCSSWTSLALFSASWFNNSSFSWSRPLAEMSSHSFSPTVFLSTSFSVLRASSWELRSEPTCKMPKKKGGGGGGREEEGRKESKEREVSGQLDHGARCSSHCHVGPLLFPGDLKVSSFLHPLGKFMSEEERNANWGGAPLWNGIPSPQTTCPSILLYAWPEGSR